MSKELNLPQIGNHYKILTFEKNENPQNIMVVYTKLNTSCRFFQSGGLPLIDFYWLMNGEKYKPTHSMIKSAVRGRLEVSSLKKDGQEFDLKVNDLKELGSHLKNPYLTIRAEKSGNECEVSTYFSEQNNRDELIEVNSLYSESRKIFTPPFRKLIAVTVRGVEVDSGLKVEKKYVAR